MAEPPKREPGRDEKHLGASKRDKLKLATEVVTLLTVIVKFIIVFFT